MKMILRANGSGLKVCVPLVPEIPNERFHIVHEDDGGTAWTNAPLNVDRISGNIKIDS